MTGEYKHSLDAKGRLFIPVRLREELGDEFYVTISSDPCLSVYSMETWNKFVERANALSFRQQRLVRPLFTNAVKCELDSQGRILLPAYLREHAHLDKNVSILGANNHAELWDADLWAQQREEEVSPEHIAAMMEELDF